MKIQKLVLLSLTLTTLAFSSSAYSQSHGIVADFVVTQSKQTRNRERIEDTMVGEYAFDGDGRMRLAINGMVYISNPVEGFVWKVHVANSVASQRRLPAAPVSGGEHRSGRSEETWRDDFSLPQPNWPTFDPQPVVEELGVRTVNKVECQGRRWTTSIPTGTFGNVNSIEIQTELWTSDAFGIKIPVLVVTRDGRDGVSRRELRNVRASSFGEAHFRPDARFTIEEVD